MKDEIPYNTWLCV